MEGIRQGLFERRLLDTIYHISEHCIKGSGWRAFGRSNRGTDARNKNERPKIFFEAAWQPSEDIHI